MGTVQLAVMRQLAEPRHGQRKAAPKEAKPEDKSKSVLTVGANHVHAYELEAEHSVYVERQSVVLPTPDLFIPPYLSHSGHGAPMRYLYPISRDHPLPFVEYNVFRASSTNILILGHLHLITSSCGCGGFILVFPNPYQGDGLPIPLRPTSLQQSTLYPDWIDLLPCPRMRDNAIRTLHLFTHDELCADLLPGLMGKQTDTNPCLIAWSNPWEPRGWKLTEGFVRKWRFLVQGCTDLFQSTNRWRALREEEPSAWELKSNAG